MNKTIIKRIFASAMMLLLLHSASMLAQTRAVKGTVVDESNEPAIGATVSVVGEKGIGAVADLDGNFTLAVGTGAKALKISYIGYKDLTVTLTRKDYYKVKLATTTNNLNEVVVVGYGTTKRGNLTNAVASLKGDRIEDRKNENALSSLQGQLAGVEINTNSGKPGGDMEVHIRGAASINASDQPLYVVDGIPQDDINDLNPDDIESIDVLKDASSSAIYGSRGANGVILIKTKTADKNDKVQIQFSANFGVQQMESKVDVFSPEEWIRFRTDYNNRKYMEMYGALGAQPTDNYDTRVALITANGGSASPYMLNDERWTMAGYGGLALIDWQDEVFRMAPKQNYQLSIANRSDNGNYRVSLGYTDQKGIAVGTSYKRLNVRANMETTLFGRITVGFNLSPSMTWSKGDEPNAMDVLTMVPVAEADAGVNTGAEPNGVYKWAGNRVSPVAKLEQSSRHSEQARVGMTAYAKGEIVKGLTAELTGSYNFSSTQGRSFIPSSISNRWSTGEGYYASASRTDGRSHYYLFQTVMNYDNTFGLHTIGAMLGFSMEGTTAYSSSLSATHFPDNELEGFDMQDVDLTRATASIGYPTRLASVFGRVQYEYDNRYVAMVSLRRDGSSKFGKNNRWGMFPSASFAYRISNEKFWPQNFAINSMKLRASWGANGNNSISSGAAVGIMGSANYSFGGALVNGYAPVSLNNDDLTWEKVYSWDFGLDFAMFGNRVNVSFDYYKKTTKDLLYKVSMPAIIGFSEKWGNIGEIHNTGVELELNTKNIVTSDFTWDTSFNMSYNTNKVVSLGENNRTVFSNNNTQVLMVGQPMRSFYMYDAVGVYQTKEDLAKYPVMKGTQLGDVRYRDVNHDGVINDDDRTLVGKPRPDYTFGMTNTFKYKNFDLSILFTAQTGGNIYSVTGRYLDRPGMGASLNMLSHWKNMWISEEQPGDGHTPGIDNSNTGQFYDTRWIYSSDYFRIKNITLGYRIPFNRKVVRSARVYFTVENVCIFDSYDGGYSPESGSDRYPQARVFSLGANFTF